MLVLSLTSFDLGPDLMLANPLMDPNLPFGRAARAEG